MASKKTKILFPIVGVLGALGIYARYNRTGCFRLTPRFPEICGSDVYWYYVVGMTFCLALPAGFIYEKYYRKKSVKEYLTEQSHQSDNRESDSDLRK